MVFRLYSPQTPRSFSSFDWSLLEMAFLAKLTLPFLFLTRRQCWGRFVRAVFLILCDWMLLGFVVLQTLSETIFGHISNCLFQLFLQNQTCNYLNAFLEASKKNIAPPPSPPLLRYPHTPWIQHHINKDDCLQHPTELRRHKVLSKPWLIAAEGVWNSWLRKWKTGPLTQDVEIYWKPVWVMFNSSILERNGTLTWCFERFSNPHPTLPQLSPPPAKNILHKVKSPFSIWWGWQGKKNQIHFSKWQTYLGVKWTMNESNILMYILM